MFHRGSAQGRRWIVAPLAAAVAVASLVPAAPRHAEASIASRVVISEVFGGGGNSNAPYKNDFVELYNPTSEAVHVSGWSVQYASANGTFNASGITTLDGTIPAHGYYLVKLAGGATGEELPTADKENTSVNLSGTNGKVALASNAVGVTGSGDPDVIDFVGYGTANDREGSAAVGALSNTRSAQRKSDFAAIVEGQGNGYDTNQNQHDFAAAEPPTPKNAQSAPEQPLALPAVAPVTATPGPGDVKPNTAITLYTPSVTASVYYSVYGPDESVLVPEQLYTGPIAIGQTSVIKAYAQKGDDRSETGTFAYTLLTKAAISNARALPNGSRAWIEGIVTYKETAGGQHNLYVQDGTAGMVVRGADLTVAVGDRIEATGAVQDYFGLPQLQAATADVVVLEPNVGAPAPAVIASDTPRESLEGQLVKIEGAAIGAGNSYQEFSTTGAYGSMIVKSSLLRQGEHYDQIVGVLTYSFNNYMILPRGELDLIRETFSVMTDTPPGIVPNGKAVKLVTPQLGGQIYYTLDGSEPTQATGTPYAGPIVITADETIVKAIVVADGATSEVFAFRYEKQKEYTGRRIHDIQGAGHRSQLLGHKVIGVEGIVTRKAGGKIMLQDEPANYDNDPHTSEAIVIVSDYNAAVGDKLRIDGTVSEIEEEGYDDANDLLTTAITSATVTKLSGGQPLPAPIVLGVDRTAPATVIDNDGFAVFDPEEDAIDFYESLESMRVELRNAKVIGPYHFEVPVVLGEQTDPMTPNGGMILTGEDFNPQKILIQRANNDVKTGDAFDAPIVGVLGYDYSNYKVIPDGPYPSVVPGSAARETTTIEPNEDKLTIAGFNIENFWNDSSPAGQTKKNNIAKAIVDNLKTPDILGLIEVQDDDGAADSGSTDATNNYRALVQAIVAHGGPSYAFTDIAPVNNADGGASGGNIRVGYLYNPARVTLVDKPKGTAATAVQYTKSGLSHNPGRIDPENAAFEDSRKPLAAEFEFRGERVVVVNNHFNSKGGDEALFGAVQPLPATLGSEKQRHAIAAVVNGFVKSALAVDPDANIVLLGDFNDFQFSKTLEILKGEVLYNEVDALPLEDRYSYIYQGNSQTLDHLLVNRALAPATTLDIVHINADFNEKHGRVSDHDPLLAQIDFALKGEEEPFELRVLHTNDTHARLDTVAKRVTAIKENKTDNAILLDAGDVFSGTLYFTKYEGLADLAFMNMAGYDAMVPGNHEFDKGPGVLETFIKAAQFPIVSANIDYSANAGLSKMFKNEIGGLDKPLENGHIYPSVALDVNGEKVGVFGLSTEETVAISSPGDTIKFRNYIERAKATVASLQAKGIDKIVALTHLGYGFDEILADEVEGIDIIVGGHSHTTLAQPVVKNADGEPTVIVQTGEYGANVGLLDATFDEGGVLQAWNGRLIAVSGYADDAEAAEMLAEYKKEIALIMEEVVGETAVDLNDEAMIDGALKRAVRLQETNLGNLIADGMAAAMKSKITALLPPSELSTIQGYVALQNGGGIREMIPAGEITMGEVRAVMPFDNSLVAVKVTGEELILALENGVSASLTPEGKMTEYGGFAHVSGMRYYYDSTKARQTVDTSTGTITSKGERIRRAEIKNADGTYAAVDPKAYYMLATNSFTASGGDAHYALKQARDAGRIYELFMPDYEVFIEHLERVGTVNIGLEGRITDLKGRPLPGSDNGDDTGSDTGSDTSPGPATTNQPNAGTSGNEVKVTLSAEDITKETNAQGKSVTKVTVKADALKTAVEAATGTSANKISIPVADVVGGIAQVRLPAGALADAGSDIVVSVSTDGQSYDLPIRVLDVNALADSLGVNADNLIISISIEVMEGEEAEAMTVLAQDVGGELLGDPVVFTVTAEGGGKTEEINDFGSTYVTRTIAIDQSIGGKNVTAVSYDPTTGELVFVPAQFQAVGGKTVATIKRNSNSVYAVVSAEKSFADVANHWSRADVELLASKLIVQGLSASAFAPDSSITRAEFAALLVRSLGLKGDASAGTFGDVATSDWYAGVIGAAAKAKLIEGFEDGTFRPNASITREQMAVMMSRALGTTGYAERAGSSNAAAKFEDGASIQAWARHAVGASVSAGVVEGTPDNRFRPAQNATRAEATAMLKRLLTYVDFIDG